MQVHHSQRASNRSDSSAFVEKHAAALIQMRAGQTAPARRALVSMKTMSPVEERMRLHAVAKTFILEQDYNQALTILLQAENAFGPYVGITADRAICQYRASHIGQWRSTYQQLANDLRAHGHLLSPASRLKTALLLAKFYDDDGAVAEAIDLCEQVLAGDLTVEETILFSAQVLRLQAAFGKSESIAKIYRNLLTLTPAEHSSYAATEVQHALALAEMQVVGPELAMARLFAIGVGSPLACDRNLLFFDLSDELLSMGATEAQKQRLLAYAAEYAVRPRDGYERLIFSLLQDRTIATSELLPLEATLPLAQFMRCLCMVASTSTMQDLRREVLLKSTFLSASFSPESGRLWRKRFGYLSAKSLQDQYNESFFIDYDPASKTISANGQVLALGRQSAQRRIWEFVISDQENKSIFAAASHLSEGVAGEGFYDRVRMNASRLCKSLLQITGIPKAIGIENSALVLNPAIKVRVLSQPTNEL